MTDYKGWSLEYWPAPKVMVLFLVDYQTGLKEKKYLVTGDWSPSSQISENRTT